MAQKTTVMNVDVDTKDEVNLIKDVRAWSNACYKCGEMGHFQRDCKYDGDKPSDNRQESDGNINLYDPIVGKWMTNLVATTPITTKAMKSLYAALNRQEELKRTYRRRYKDLQAVVTPSTTTPATTSHPTVLLQVVKLPRMCKQLRCQQLDQKRRLQIKERLNLLVKERNTLPKHPVQQQVLLLIYVAN